MNILIKRESIEKDYGITVLSPNPFYLLSM